MVLASSMIYHLYQAYANGSAPLRSAARIGAQAVWQSKIAPPSSLPLRVCGAICDLIVGTGLTHERPSFGIGPVQMGNRAVEVVEEIAAETPHAALLRFRKDTGIAQPRVLLVARCLVISQHFCAEQCE